MYIYGIYVDSTAHTLRLLCHSVRKDDSLYRNALLAKCHAYQKLLSIVDPSFEVGSYVATQYVVKISVYTTAT